MSQLISRFFSPFRFFLCYPVHSFTIRMYFEGSVIKLNTSKRQGNQDIMT